MRCKYEMTLLFGRQQRASLTVVFLHMDAAPEPVAAGQPDVVGGAQGGITHFGSLYWGKSLTL